MLSITGPAIVVAVSPVALIMALTLVVSARSSAAVLGFALARAVAIAAVTIGFVFLSSLISPDPGVLRRIASVLEAVLAVFFLGAALWAWFKRRERLSEPALLRRVEGFGWWAGVALGLVIWLANPKVLVTVVLTACSSVRSRWAKRSACDRLRRDRLGSRRRHRPRAGRRGPRARGVLPACAGVASRARLARAHPCLALGRSSAARRFDRRTFVMIVDLPHRAEWEQAPRGLSVRRYLHPSAGRSPSPGRG